MSTLEAKQDSSTRFDMETGDLEKERPVDFTKIPKSTLGPVTAKQVLTEDIIRFIVRTGYNPSNQPADGLLNMLEDNEAEIIVQNIMAILKAYNCDVWTNELDVPDGAVAEALFGGLQVGAGWKIFSLSCI